MQGFNRKKIEHKCHRPKNQGFTILELMIAVAILGVLIRLSAPSFISFIADARLSSSSQTVVMALNYAKNEAAMAGAPVRVIPNSADWRNGFIIQNIAGTTIRQVDALPPSIVLSGGIASLSGIIFYPDGSSDVSGASPWLRFCDGRAGVPGRVITINGSGYISVYPTLASGGSGANAACS